VAVEALGILGQRLVATQAHVLDDRLHVAADVLIAFAAVLDQPGKALGEIGSVS
jgi:hypothetical protein